MSLRVLALVLCAGTHLLAAQSAVPTPIYAESFRQGSTRIIEEHSKSNSLPRIPFSASAIKDSHGVDRYIFSITPQGPEGDTEITSWQVKLADLHHSIYDNILLTTQQPSADPKNTLSHLDPSSFSPVPVLAQRIIKVEGFYVVLQVKAYHFTPPDSPYLDSMAVAVELTNTDPRTAGSAPQ